MQRRRQNQRVRLRFFFHATDTIIGVWLLSIVKLVMLVTKLEWLLVA